MRNYLHVLHVPASESMGRPLDGAQVPPHHGGNVIRYSSNDKPSRTFLGA
jgi:hypothetical protein